MPTVNSKVNNIPEVQPRAEYGNGDLLATTDGCVWIQGEADSVTCIAVGSGSRNGHYLGEQFDSTDPYELEENIGSYMINPCGLSITITVS